MTPFGGGFGAFGGGGGKDQAFGGGGGFKADTFGGPPKSMFGKTFGDNTKNPPDKPGRSEPPTVVKLTGLTGHVERTAVETALNSFGTVMNVRFRKGLALVTFDTESAAKRAIGKTVIVEGAPVKVEKAGTATPQQEQKQEASLKVQPVPGNYQDDDLRKAVPSRGLVSVHVVRRDGRAMYGYANYGSREDADHASRYVQAKQNPLGSRGVTCTVRTMSSDVRMDENMEDDPMNPPGGGLSSGAPPEDDDEQFDQGYDDVVDEESNEVHKTVVFSKPKPVEKKEPSLARTVRVDGLPSDMDDGRLRNFFESFGSVVAVSIERPGLGLVVYDDSATAQLAAKELDALDAFNAGTPITCRVLNQQKPTTTTTTTTTKKLPPSPLKTAATATTLKKTTATTSPFRSFGNNNDEGPTTTTTEKDPDGKPDLVGECEQMCPEPEIEERVRFKELDAWEKPDGWETMDDGKLAIAARQTAVKKYKRSDAGSIQNVPSLVRPPHVLASTFAHLATKVMGSQNLVGSQDNVIESYLFLWDRCRAIRKDFILQNYTTGGNVDKIVMDVLEKMARFFIVMERRLETHPEWRDGVAHGKHNAESLSETLSALLAFYDMAHKQGSSSSAEAECTAYWLLFFCDHEQGSAAAGLLARLALDRPDLHGSTAVRRAAQLRAARAEGNYARFFKIAKASPYVVKCLVATLFLKDVRESAFHVMSRAYARGEVLPMAHLQRLLCFESSDLAADAAQEAGFVVDVDRRTATVKPRSSLPVAMDDMDDVHNNNNAVSSSPVRPPPSDNNSMMMTGLFDAFEAIATRDGLTLGDVVLLSDKARPLFLDDGTVLTAVPVMPAIDPAAEAAEAKQRRDEMLKAQAERKAEQERAMAEEKARVEAAREQAEKERERRVELERQERQAAEARQKQLEAEAQRQAQIHQAQIDAARRAAEVAKAQREAAEREAMRQLEDDAKRRAQAEALQRRRAEEARRKAAKEAQEIEDAKKRALELKIQRQADDAIKATKDLRKADDYYVRTRFTRFIQRLSGRRHRRINDARLSALMWLRSWRRKTRDRLEKRHAFHSLLDAFNYDPGVSSPETRRVFGGAAQRRSPPIKLLPLAPPKFCGEKIDVDAVVAPALADAVQKAVAEAGPIAKIRRIPKMAWKLAVVGATKVVTSLRDWGTDEDLVVLYTDTVVINGDAKAILAVLSDRYDVLAAVKALKSRTRTALAIVDRYGERGILEAAARGRVRTAGVFTEVPAALDWLARETASLGLVQAISAMDLVLAQQGKTPDLTTALKNTADAVQQFAPSCDCDDTEALVEVPLDTGNVFEAGIPLPEDWADRTSVIAALRETTDDLSSLADLWVFEPLSDALKPIRQTKKRDWGFEDDLLLSEEDDDTDQPLLLAAQKPLHKIPRRSETTISRQDHQSRIEAALASHHDADDHFERKLLAALRSDD